MSSPSVIGLITARGGSKGIPRKNIKPLAGKPLIVWTIEAALQSRRLERVLVSTDDEEIGGIARRAGAEVPFIRPAELARDDSPSFLTSEHALAWLEKHDGVRPDYVMLLQPTVPFRTAEDIDAAIKLAEDKNAPAVVSVSEAKRHPFRTYQLAADGTMAEFFPCDIAYRRRQDLPTALAENGAIYLNRRDALLADKTYIPTGSLAYLMPPERSLDIDSPWDWFLADLVARHPTRFQ